MEKIVLVTSLHRLRKFRACRERYDYLVLKLGPGWGDEDKINLLDILEHNGVSDCLWALRATVRHPDGDSVMRLMAADFAEGVLPFFERAYPDDMRPRLAIKAVRDYVAGKISVGEFYSASDAANGAVRLRPVSWAAYSAAKAAAWASVGKAAWIAALESAYWSVDAFVENAMVASDTATTEDIGIKDAVTYTSWSASHNAALCTQAKIIRRHLTR